MENKILLRMYIILTVIACYSIYTNIKCFNTITDQDNIINRYSYDLENNRIKYDELNVTYYESLNISRYDERCIMYDTKGNIKGYKQSNVNGLFFNNLGFYMVWMKDRTLENQDKTDRHEYCHYLVEYNYEHFCGEI